MTGLIRICIDQSSGERHAVLYEESKRTHNSITFRYKLHDSHGYELRDTILLALNRRLREFREILIGSSYMAYENRSALRIDDTQEGCILNDMPIEMQITIPLIQYLTFPINVFPLSEMADVHFMESLSDTQKLEMTKKAKTGTWYDDNYTPYCGQDITKCSSPRMVKMTYGFRCPECGNTIGFNFVRLKNSALNSPLITLTK